MGVEPHVRLTQSKLTKLTESWGLDSYQWYILSQTCIIGFQLYLLKEFPSLSRLLSPIGSHHVSPVLNNVWRTLWWFFVSPFNLLSKKIWSTLFYLGGRDTKFISLSKIAGSPENCKSKKGGQKVGGEYWGPLEVGHWWPYVPSKECHSNWFIGEYKFAGLLYPKRMS